MVAIILNLITIILLIPFIIGAVFVSICLIKEIKEFKK